ncbi:hypothetical protein MCOR19_004932 [Pyricularia oryzae]|nr:hypothetical protein MCOR19_004932 [Pyricularia oryzae]KAI6323022.1 hypothetical protein MCOR30_007423 [Pyricularia oryzae]KAI6493547.1 hypothetical protein MCOR18_001420 [Pyricularia oryzae]KAI6602499.1 hypothetical protein MCOR12_003732 [Pyricularia oryzae]
MRYNNVAEAVAGTCMLLSTSSQIKTTQDSIIQAIAGTWTLLNTTTTRNGVLVENVYGISPVGILLYTVDGYMSATITSTHPQDRPAALSFPPRADQSDSDWATIAKRSISYAGPFVINDQVPTTETSGQIFHGPLTVANVPSWIGTKQVRNYTLYENGRLLFITSKREDGSEGQLWWTRST